MIYNHDTNLFHFRSFSFMIVENAQGIKLLKTFTVGVGMWLKIGTTNQNVTHGEVDTIMLNINW